jgi:hypothetical protein
MSELSFDDTLWARQSAKPERRCNMDPKTVLRKVDEEKFRQTGDTPRASEGR